MIKRLWYWCAQDFVLAFRNAFMPLLIGMIVLMSLVVRFALPKDWSPAESYYYADQTAAGEYRNTLIREGVGEEYFLAGAEELQARIKEDAYSIGVLFAEDNGAVPRITILHSDRVGQKSLNILKSVLNAVAARVAGEAASDQAPATFLRPQTTPVPRNLSSVPALVVFEVIVLGFMFAAVFIFQEKSEGTILAYRVTPGGTAVYILAKTLAFMVLGAVYGCGLVAATMGFDVDYARLLPLILLGVNLYTFIGISVAVFFRNMSSWFFAGVLLLTLNMAPVVSLVYPTFSPVWLSLLPSYPVVFGVGEVLFPSGKSILPTVAMLGAGNILAYAICHSLTRWKLMREGRS